jgi:hypothetical protein
MKETVINIGGKDVVFTSLPSNLKTMKYLSIIYKTRKNMDMDTINSIIVFISESLKNKYDDDEIDEILSSINLEDENGAEMIDKIISSIFSLAQSTEP